LNITNIINKKNKPLKVLIKRGDKLESFHRVHCVITNINGEIVRQYGSNNFRTYIRSSLKPFQAIPFIRSGSVEKYKYSQKTIAIACGSHSGENYQIEEVKNILKQANIDIKSLKCPAKKNSSSALYHNCSGKHAAFLVTCKEMKWPTNNYLQLNHPLNLEIINNLSKILDKEIKKEDISRDNCGAPTFLLKLSEIAKLYSYIAKQKQEDITTIFEAMTNYPEMVSGKGCFDTEVMKLARGQILSKGGSEGVQCISNKVDGLAVAIKVEDGAKRAKHAVAIHLLREFKWLDSYSIDKISAIMFDHTNDVEIEVV
tara:strand:- start:10174 stop:11115 length:942 start_codon:yes stop_codon:yes gene_type:complete